MRADQLSVSSPAAGGADPIYTNSERPPKCVSTGSPLTSRLAADGLLSRVAAELSSTLRLLLSVIVPFSVAMLVLGPALATVMFSWGAAAGDTDKTMRTFTLSNFGEHVTIEAPITPTSTPSSTPSATP